MEKIKPIAIKIIDKKLSKIHKSDIDDIVNISLLKIFRNLTKWEGRGFFLNWVRVTVNTCIVDYFRKSPQFEILFPEIETVDVKTQKQEEAKSRNQDLDECIEKVSKKNEKLRNVYELVWVQEMKQVDVAKRLGISERSVRNYLDEFYKLIRECINNKNI